MSPKCEKYRLYFLLNVLINKCLKVAFLEKHYFIAVNCTHLAKIKKYFYLQTYVKLLYSSHYKCFFDLLSMPLLIV